MERQGTNRSGEGEGEPVDLSYVCIREREKKAEILNGIEKKEH